MDEAVTAAEKRAAGTSAYFYVDTLDYLRRGGRIGAAQALLGSALAVKPLLRLNDGRIELLEKVRTASRAIARLEEIVSERAGNAQVDIAVHHLAAPERASALATAAGTGARAGRPACERGRAVIGAHTGPGLLGPWCHPCRDDIAVALRVPDAPGRVFGGRVAGHVSASRKRCPLLARVTGCPQPAVVPGN